MSWDANIANEVLGHTERELASARSTIAELQKRLDKALARAEAAEQALTNKRQRREEAG